MQEGGKEREDSIRWGEEGERKEGKETGEGEERGEGVEEEEMKPTMEDEMKRSQETMR